MPRHKARCPWEDQAVVRLREQRYAAQDAYKVARTTANLRVIQSLGRELKKVYSECYERYITSQCALIENNFHCQRTDLAYRTLDRLAGRKARSRSRISGTPAERLSKFKEHFEAVSAGPGSRERHPELVLPTTFPPEVRELYDTNPITLSEVRLVLGTLKNGKAAGCDEIPVEIWKIPGMAEVIIDLLNQCLKEGTVPTEWQTLLIVPVPKKGDLSLPTNYRGISLMCVIAKIFNKIILLRLRHVLEGRLLCTQNGFRPGRSTTSHIVALRELLQHTLQHPDLSLVICFIDFTKAFDSVNWDWMKAILISYQVPQLLVNSVMSLYEGARARVKTPDGLSDVFDLLRGVLQGDTLAPYLFIVVVDYLLRRALSAHPEVSYLLKPGLNSGPATRAARKREATGTLRVTEGVYADDTYFISGGKGPLPGFISDLQRLLREFYETAKQVQLTFNIPKCDILAVESGRTLKANLELVEINDSAKLRTVSEFKYLGSQLVSVKSDINGRFGQAWAACKGLRKFWRCGAVPRPLKATVFKALCLSICTYASPSWLLNANLHNLMQGKLTRMLKYAMGFDVTAHIPLAQIYGSIDPMKAIVTQRRMDMVASHYRTQEIRPQLMCQVLDYTGTQPKSLTSPSSLAHQLIDDYNYATGAAVSDFAVVRQAMMDRERWTALTRRAVERIRAEFQPIRQPYARRAVIRPNMQTAVSESVVEAGASTPIQQHSTEHLGSPTAQEPVHWEPVLPTPGNHHAQTRVTGTRRCKRSPIRNRGGGSRAATTREDVLHERRYYQLKTQRLDNLQQDYCSVEAREGQAADQSSA